MRRSPTTALVPVLAAVLLLVGCSGEDDAPTTAGTGAADDGRPTIVVSTSILGDVTSAVVGDRADVEVLLPPGGDPHGYEPSAQDVATMTEADLVVVNGLGLEEGLEPVLDQVADDGVPVLRVAPELAPIPFAGGGHGHTDEGEDHADEGEDHADEGEDHTDEGEDHTDEGEDHTDEGEDHTDEGEDHDHGDAALDPHVWMDPDRMTTAAYLVADAVAEATGLDAQALTADAAAFDEQLRAVDEEVQGLLADIPEERRVLVTNHDSLGYFAERYGFEIVGTVIPGGSTLAEPSAGELAELAEVVADAGVPAIFADATVDTALADALAAETGTDVEVVTLYTGSLGPEGSGAETYVGLLTTNAQRIAGALGG